MAHFKPVLQAAMDKGYLDEMMDCVEEVMDRIKRTDPQFHDEVMRKAEELAYKIPVEEAEQIVRGMRPKGQYWSYEQIKDFVAGKGITKDCVSWYLVMNMKYNDYYNTAKQYGLQNDVEFFYSLAKDFIDDPDAKPHKVEKYFLD